MNVRQFEFHNIMLRVLEDKHQSWFVARDICQALDFQTNVTVYLKKLDRDEVRRVSRNVLDMRPGGRPVPVVSESGLYKLIMRADSPAAKEFQDWVTRAVLPAVRRDGMYVQGEETVDWTQPEKVAELKVKTEESWAQKEAAYLERIQALETQLQEAAPKVKAYEHLIDTAGTFTVSEAASFFGMTAAKLNRFFRELGVKCETSDRPSHAFLSKGWFEAKVYQDPQTYVASPKYRLTTKALADLGEFLTPSH